jgi:hypothetical protein
MKDLKAELEKLLTNAEDCTLIARLAADKQKRETFARIAQHLRASWLLTFMPKLPPDHTKEMVTRYLR